MKKFLWVALIVCSFSIGNANAPLNLYNIDASTRGSDFYDTLTTAFTSAGNSGEVVIQTMATPPYIGAPGLNSGLIPFVQQGTLTLDGKATSFPYKAPNSTLFIFPYNNVSKAKGITLNTNYIVVGIEQIVTMAYTNVSSFTFPNPPFTSVFASNLLPLYTINPTYRAADIVDVTNKFLKNPSAFNGSPGQSQVWIVTNLTGPFYVPFANNVALGSIPNVLSISQLSNEFLLITYKPLSINYVTAWSVIVAAEQVQQIVFYPSRYPPS